MAQAMDTEEGMADNTSMVNRPLRMNRERIIAFPAGKHTPQNWATWSTEQRFLDKQQRMSWIKDQSVIEPGRMPCPPLYGATRELQLKAGDAMPTIFAQRLTPTDISQLHAENQKLRNQVLDRILACPICDEEFETYEKDQIRDHIRLHQQLLEESGQCPSCGDPQWAFMTNDEKRAHFSTHQSQHEGSKIKKFYADQRCPVCDMDLSKMRPEHVIRHCLDHAPGQVRFCDRCGLDELDCDAMELDHHHISCRLAEARKPGDPVPKFCANCGLSGTHLTPDQNVKHLVECRSDTAGKFCTKCALDQSSLTAAAIAKHQSHCVSPCGFAKRFCEKCCTEVASLDAHGTAHHHKACRLAEPDMSTERSRLLGIYST